MSVIQYIKCKCIFFKFFCNKIFCYSLYRQVGLSVHQIQTLLFDEKVVKHKNRQVVMVPRPEELLSDKDSDVEEDTQGAGMNVDHMSKGMLMQAAELELLNCSDEEPDVEVINEAGEVVATVVDENNMPEEEAENRMYCDEEDEEVAEPVAGPSNEKRRRKSGLPGAVAAAVAPVSVTQLGRKKNTERLWSRSPAAQFSENIPPFEQVLPSKAVDENTYLPYDFLRLFITDEFLDKLSTKSQLYCARRGHIDKAALLTQDNLLTSMGIMYLSGYLTPAQKELWWENRPDTQHMWVKKAMTRDTFRTVTCFTYFTEPEDQDLSDPFWKVRPLFDELNRTAKQLVQQTEYVSVDESMIRYFGPHPLKQCIREKPERYGYKVWCLATPAGELLAAQPYAGAKTMIEDVGLGQGPNVVYGLCEQFGLSTGSKVACDNLFTSFDLLEHMAERDWGVLGEYRYRYSIIAIIVNIPKN